MYLGNMGSNTLTEPVWVGDSVEELETDSLTVTLTVPLVDPEGEREREGEDVTLLEGVTVKDTEDEVVLEGHRESLDVTLGVNVTDALKHKLGLPDKLCVTDFVMDPDLL